jgi:hypothetical protein
MKQNGTHDSPNHIAFDFSMAQVAFDPQHWSHLLSGNWSGKNFIIFK